MSGLDFLVSTRVAADLGALVFLKGSGVLLAVTLIVRLLRNRSAALRHRVWTVGLVALLALPIVGRSLPDLSANLGLLSYPAETPLLGMAALETQPRVQASVPVEATTIESATPTGLPLATLILVAWWVGAIVLGTMIVADLIRTEMLRIRSRRLGPDHPVARFLDRERRALGIRRPVELLVSHQEGLAATLGSLKPAVVLGPDVIEMSEEELRPVLIHELAHVRRGDFLTNLLTTMATTVYWPNPLFWLARRQAALEREQACDDEVLSTGITSPHYARVLLKFAVAQRGMIPAVRGTVGLLRFSATKSRLSSILDSGLDRRRLSVIGHIGALVALVILSVGVGSLDLLASPPGTGSNEELVQAFTHTDATVRARAARTLGRRDPGWARLELEALLDDPVADVRLAAVGGLEQLADPASTTAMARVLERPFDSGRGEHGFVLKLAMLTLGHLDSDLSVEILEAQLDRPVEQLRWLALETILSMRDHRDAALPHLERFAVSDPSERNRRLAREALAAF